jgi:hypothetical protein
MSSDDTFKILRDKAVVTTVTLTYDGATWTPFSGDDELARVLRAPSRFEAGG